MSLQPLIDEYTQRVKQLQQQLAMSGTMYTQKENDLKQHLAHHNTLIGELNVTNQTLEKMTKANADSPSVPVEPPLVPNEASETPNE